MSLHKFLNKSLHKSLLPAVISLLASIAAPSLAQNPCADRGKYPVIVYNAATRVPAIRMADNGALTADAPPAFLCDGKPVEIFVQNRKLLSSYSATLTNAFSVPIKVIDLRNGTTTTSQPPAGGGTTPPPAPGAKGFNLPATISGLLTTDKAVGYLLDDETFDIPFNQVADHAATVREEFEQLKANLDLYNAYLHTVTDPQGGIPWPPRGELTLRGLQAEWAALDTDVVNTPGPVSETQFKAWINRADRLVTESSRVNTKLQQFPVVDTAINLTASLKAIEDNFRALRDEEDALQEAVRLIKDMGSSYQKVRAKNELTNTLRQHLSSTSTITDPTLLQIVEAFAADSSRKGPLFLKVLHLDATDICATGAPGGFPANYAPLVRYCGFRGSDLALRDELTASQADWHVLRVRLAELNDFIVAANNAQGAALQALNTVYDQTTVPGFQRTNLPLAGASGNLVVYYTLALNEQFNRYQIVNEIAEPVSNCQLALSAAATSTTITGFAPCTTASSSTNAAPSSTLSASGYPPLQPTPPIGTTAPVAPTASGGANPQEFFGRVEVHHFSHGALVTGVAYDSIKQSSFSWVACPTSPLPANANGNPVGVTGTTISPPPSSGGCISPTTASGSATPAPTYYQLQPQNGPTVAVVEGVDLFLFDNFNRRHLNQGGARDMFKSHMAWTPFELYLAASAYPINHYYVGLSEEPLQGFHFSLGLSGSVQSSISSSSGYTVGTVSTSNTTSIPTTSHFKHGWFFEVGFDTSLFGQIFNKNFLSNVLTLGSAGGNPPPAPAASQ